MEGIAAALREAVVPELSDSYARSQAEVAANLIANLATRVQWRPDMLQAELGRLEPILAHAARIAPRHLLDPGARAPAAETGTRARSSLAGSRLSESSRPCRRGWPGRPRRTIPSSPCSRRKCGLSSTGSWMTSSRACEPERASVPGSVASAPRC